MLHDLGQGHNANDVSRLVIGNHVKKHRLIQTKT